MFLILALAAGCFAAAQFLRSDEEATVMVMPVVLQGDSKAFVDDGSTASLDSTATDPVDVSNLPLPDRINQRIIDEAEHPFDPLLAIANLCLKKMDAEVFDYTATLTSQLRIDEKLQPPRKLFCKIRHFNDDPKDASPFSVYTKFIEPKANAGQEAIWVDGWNEGNLVAHTTGIANLKRFYLSPESSLAMDGSLHPIYDIGFRNLIVSMSKIGRKDRVHGECVVTVKKDLMLNGRKCMMLEAKHPVQRDHFEFHIARIYIDYETEFPVAYEGFLWPEEPGGEPVPLEKYYYSDIKLNVGLKDIDFDPANKEYAYPSW